MRKRVQYNEETKLRVIKRVLEDGLPVSVVCREEGMDPSNVRLWIAKYTSTHPVGTPDEATQATMTNEEWKKEYDRLKKANDRTLLELEIVKKAVGIISRMP